MSKQTLVDAKATALPAHKTKHVAELQYTFMHSSFRLTQQDSGITNGTALWLGAQCLSVFLADIYGNKHRSRQLAAHRRPRVIELGSGIGLSALALSSMGWDVLATDLPDVIESVLSDNIAKNTPNLPLGSGMIQVRALDWTVPHDLWSWDNDSTIASPTGVIPSHAPADGVSRLGPPFDLVITADTVYSPALAQPLVLTLKALSELSQYQSSSGSVRYPPIYVCLERRDPNLVDQTLALAGEMGAFVAKRIPPNKVAQAMDKGGLLWDREDWDGVEIWTLTRKSR